MSVLHRAFTLIELLVVMAIIVVITAMPWRTEVDAWLIVAAALRAELADDRVAAQAQWRAFKALPPLKRLLRGHIPSIELEITADCRIALLSQAP